MNLRPHSSIPIVGGLVAALAFAIGLAAVTRPIDRTGLPRDTAAALPELRALHTGSGPCRRWAPPQEFTGHADLAGALHAAGFHPDLHNLLPLLSAIRVANVEYAASHHALSPDEEFRQVALAHLGPFDRLRLQAGRHDVDELVPTLQSFAERRARLELDRRRVAAFRSTLPPVHIAKFEQLVSDWAGPLADERAQALAVDGIASDVTTARLQALRGLLARHRERFGVYPAGFDALLGGPHVPGVLRRGQERDGSLRDGWLRPMEYYRVGRDSYRLRSLGALSDTDADDFLLHP